MTLESVELEHFKCFQQQVVPLNDLTLLTGVNSAGKSTVISSLGLLQQSFSGPVAKGLILNGECFKVGRANDIIDRQSDKNTLGITVAYGDAKCRWQFSCQDRNATVLPIAAFSINDTKYKPKKDDLRFAGSLFPLDLTEADTSAVEPLMQAFRTMQYISADRVGPKEFYELSASYNAIGHVGQHLGFCLYEYSGSIDKDRVLKSVPPTLIRQAGARLQQFFPGASFEVNPVLNTNLVTMRYRTNPQHDFHRPQNVGYGFSQVMPIIVACLVAKKGEVVLIENPEIHLHPKAQAQMGLFLAEMAGSGLQIIVESHSDHVLNGICRAVKRKAIPADKVAVHFFSQREGDLQAQVITPSIDEHGLIDRRPEDFFDQTEKDMMELADWD